MPGQEEKEGEVSGFNFGPPKEDEPNISTSQDVDEEIGFSFAPVNEGAGSKKEAVTPIRKEEAAEVAANPIPEDRRRRANPGQSYQSVLPSRGIGSDSPLSEDKAPGEDLSRFLDPSYTGLNPEQKAEAEAVIAEEAQAEQPAWKQEAEAGAEAVRESTQRTGENVTGLEDSIEEINNDPTLNELQRQEATVSLLIDRRGTFDEMELRDEKRKSSEVKGYVDQFNLEAGDDPKALINIKKNKLVDRGRFISQEIKDEYAFTRKVNKLTSKDYVLTQLSNTTTPHNAIAKLAAINKSENKEEDLAAYKQELLDQIAKDNKEAGNHLTDTDLKRFANKSIEEIAAISGTFSDIKDKVSRVEDDRSEFLSKKHKKINEEIEEKTIRLNKGGDDLTEEKRKILQDDINKRKALKESFYESDGAKTAGLIFNDIKKGSATYNSYRDILENVPKNLSPKEKFDVFYIALREDAMNSLLKADLLDGNGEYDATIENTFRDFLGVESVMGIDFSGEILGSLTEAEVEAMQKKGKVDELTNIYLNNTAYSSENYWDEFIGSLASGLAPNMTRASGKQSDTQQARNVLETTKEYGVLESAGISKEHVGAFADLVASPEGLTWQKSMETLGGSGAMMVQLMGGGAVLKTAKVGKLGRAITKGKKFLDKSKIGKVFVHALEQGATAKVSGDIFNDDDQLAFDQFFVGSGVSKVAEMALKATGMKFAAVLVNKLGVKSKVALDFTGQLFTRAFGEFTDESMQTIVAAYDKSAPLKGTIAELRKQFPDMDSVTEFAVLTGIMGASFGVMSSYSDVRTRLIEGGYDVKKADAIMDEVAKQTKGAAEVIDSSLKEDKEGEEGHLTPVTDKKSPVKGGDTFTVGEDSYQINSIDKDFNVNVTIDGKEKTLTKEEFSKLRRGKGFQLYRESKASTKSEKVEVKKEVKPVVPAEVINDESGETEYTNKEGEFFSEEEVVKMTPEQLSEMTVKNPSDAVQAKVAPVAEVAGEGVEGVDGGAAVEGDVATEKQQGGLDRRINRSKKDFSNASTVGDKAKALLRFLNSSTASKGTVSNEDMAWYNEKRKELEADGYVFEGEIGRELSENEIYDVSNREESDSVPKGTTIINRVGKPKRIVDGKQVGRPTYDIIIGTGTTTERDVLFSAVEDLENSLTTKNFKEVTPKLKAAEKALKEYDAINFPSPTGKIEVKETTTGGETETKTEPISETAGETKVETKAETTKPVDSKKTIAAKKSEAQNNRLVDNVKAYNKRTPTQKKSKSGQELLSKIGVSSGVQGYTVSKENGKIVVSDSKGKKIKPKNEFAPTAVDEFVSQDVSAKDQIWAVNEVNDGTLDGDAKTGRIHLQGLVSTGLTPAQITDGVDKIKDGNTTSVNAKRVIAGLADARAKGVYEMSDGKGGLTSVPISEVSTRELTEEELVSKEDLDAESAIKAEEQSQAQKIQDSTDAFVEKVKKLKVKMPGSFNSSLGAVEVWNGAVQLIATTIKASGSTAAAVAKAIAYVKDSDWYKKKLPIDKKKINDEMTASLVDIAEQAAAEKAKEDSSKGLTDKQKAKKEAKEKRDEAKKKEAEALLSRIEEAAKPLKEGEAKDPNVKKKVRKYVLSMLTNPNVSEEVKERIREDPDAMYDQQSNAWSITQAMEVVDSFANEEGGLEFLLEDVKNNFLKYGAVGAVILDGIATLYARDGRFNDSHEVGMALAKIGTIMGQAVQMFSQAGSDDIVKAYFKTSMGAGLRAKKEVKEYRDKKLNERIDSKNPKSKKRKEAILDTKEEFTGTVDEFIERVARGDKEALAFIDKALKKSEKADAGKKKTPKKTSESRKKSLAKEKAYRKKRIADAKKNRGNYLNSSFGLTKEGVEMVLDVTASYVRSGIINTKVLADKIRTMMKEDFDHDISDADLEKVLGDSKVKKGIEDESLKTASETLAKKVLSHTSNEGNEKTADAVDILIKNLFAKAKETLPARAKKETDESYREKLFEAMAEQDFAREVWDKSKNTISDILDNKQAKGEMTSAEKAQVLKELEEFFGDKVGAPFSKSLVGNAIKEQLKSDNETIRDIVAEHYSKVEKNGKSLDSSQKKGRDLAEKIVASTSMSPEKATELKKIIEKEFTEALRKDAEKVLAKVLGVENLSQEKLDAVIKKNKVTVDAILKAVNAGALTNESFLDAFSTAFNFGTISDADISKINALVYDLTLLPVKSIARDMALIDFRTYLDVLSIDNQSFTKRYVTGLAYGLFYQNILGNAPTVLRSAYGIINSSIIEASISIMNNPVLFAHDFAKAWRHPGTTAKGYFNHLAASRQILKDALRRGYIPYESGLESVEDSSTKLGYLDRLANADLKDLSKKEKALRAAQWVPNKQLRLLMATDAIGHYNARKRHVRTKEYNKLLAAGRSRFEKSFWEDLEKNTGNTKELRAEALLQAENEKANLESQGVDVSNFNTKQRASNIIFNNLKEDTQIFSDRMATQMRMGHHPKGWFGFIYDFITKASRAVPGSAFILPFLRIPLNMADAALDYVPLVGLYRGVFGRGWMMRGQEGEDNLFNSAFLDKTRSKKEHISEDRAGYLFKAAMGATAIGATLAAVVSQATKKDDDDDKVFQVVYKGTGSYADNKRLGLRQYHYRVKVGGKWMPWMDYRDSPLYMILAFSGGVSDKLAYDREDPDTLVNSEEIKDAIYLGVGSAVMSAKEQNFIQSANDLIDIVRSEKSFLGAVGEYAAQTAVRTTKGVLIPSALTTDYNYYKTLTGQSVKADTKIEDGAGQYMLDRFTRDIPFAEDYKEIATDGLGTPIEIENKVPFVSDDLVKKDDSNPITQLTKGTQLIEKDVAAELGEDRDFVYSEGINIGKEIPVKNKKKMREEYKRRLLEAYDNEVFGNIESLKEDRDADGKRLYESTLRGIQERVEDELSSDSEWDYVFIEP